MIHRLRLQNFKSHKDTRVVFAPVTSFVGGNDDGKTNIFRALRMVGQHEDWPERWIRWGQTRAEIEIETEQGALRRIRTKATEKIEITRGGKVETYTGQLAAVKYVKEITGLHKVVLDNPSSPYDLNFISVFSPPFLVLDPPQTVQKKVAAIVGGNDITEARKALAKEEREISNRKALYEDQLSALDEEIRVEEQRLGLLESRLSSLEELGSKATRLRGLADEAASLREAVRELDSPLYKPSTISELKLLLEKAQKGLSSLRGAVLAYQNTTSLSKELGSLVGVPRGEITRAQGLVLQASNLLRKTEDVHKKALEIRSLAASLRTVREEEQADLQDREGALQKREAAQESRREVLKEMGVCPTCGQSVP